MPKHSQKPTGPSKSTVALIILAAFLLLGCAGAFFFFGARLFPSTALDPEPQPASSSRMEAALTPAPTPRAAAPTPSPTPQPTPSPTLAPTPSPTPAPIADNGEDARMDGGICLWNSMAFELFYGSDESAVPYAQAIEGFAQAQPHINVYNIIVPIHSEFGLPQRIRDGLGCGSQRQNTATAYSCYNKAHPVDIGDTLDQHKTEYIYFNTDTHWTALGAYYAYRELCSAAGVAPAELDSFIRTDTGEFYGYLYEMTYDSTLGPDHIDVYEPGFAYTAALSYDGQEFAELDSINSPDSSAGYSMFLHGDNPCFRIVNHDLHTGRRLVLVKESYGNAVGAFLAASFDEVYVVDLRHFPGSLPAACEAWGATDVLFLNGIMASNTYERVEELRTLLS